MAQSFLCTVSLFLEKPLSIKVACGDNHPGDLQFFTKKWNIIEQFNQYPDKELFHYASTVIKGAVFRIKWHKTGIFHAYLDDVHYAVININQGVTVTLAGNGEVYEMIGKGGSLFMNLRYYLQNTAGKCLLKTKVSLLRLRLKITSEKPAADTTFYCLLYINIFLANLFFRMMNNAAA